MIDMLTVSLIGSWLIGLIKHPFSFWPWKLFRHQARSNCTRVKQILFLSLIFAVTVSFALAALALPGNFEHYLGLVKALEIPAWIIFSGKTVLAWPLSYHSFNGIRHLVKKKWNIKGLICNVLEKRIIKKEGFRDRSSHLVNATSIICSIRKLTMEHTSMNLTQR